MPRKKPISALLLAACAAVACVTINVYFPEAAVRDLSERIEDAVAKEAAAGAEPAAEPKAEGSGGTGLASRLRSGFEIAVGSALYLLAPAPAYAQPPPPSSVAAPEITNPAIRRIIESRAARVRALDRYKAAGAVGENRAALVETRNLNALPLAERAAVQKLVREENADRERMFKEIAAATGADLSQLPRIQETYAETLRQKARRGDWIQLLDGRWQQKP